MFTSLLNEPSKLSKCAAVPLLFGVTPLPYLHGIGPSSKNLSSLFVASLLNVSYTMAGDMLKCLQNIKVLGSVVLLGWDAAKSE